MPIFFHFSCRLRHRSFYVELTLYYNIYKKKPLTYVNSLCRCTLRQTELLSNCLFYNFLNNNCTVSSGGILLYYNYFLSSSSGRIAAGTFAAFCVFVAATHCAQRNSSDKKNFLHNLNALNKLDLRVISEIGCKISTFFAHIQKKM